MDIQKVLSRMKIPSGAEPVSEQNCLFCASKKMFSLLRVERMPFSSQVLFKNRQEAESCTTRSLHIRMCEACGIIYDSDYFAKASQESGYNCVDYFSSATCSGQARAYQTRLAKLIHDMWSLTNKRICEVGCGDGFFLNELSKFSGSAIGFEPSPTYSLAKQYPGVTVFHDYFYPDRPHQDIRGIHLFILRHVLEHFSDPFNCLENLKNFYDETGDGQALFLEVPDAAFLIEENLYCDFYIDHIFYFTEYFLANFLRRIGWHSVRPINTENREFLGLFSVGLDGAGISQVPRAQESLSRKAFAFSRNYEHWKWQLLERLCSLKAKKRKIGVWGAGSRGVTMMTSLGVDRDFFTYVIDTDSHKQNRYVPLLGTPILSADILKEEPVDCLLVTAYTYFDEIAKSINENCGGGMTVLNPYRDIRTA
jgi:hypothetical protein